MVEEITINCPFAQFFLTKMLGSKNFCLLAPDRELMRLSLRFAFARCGALQVGGGGRGVTDSEDN
jgi:hypothetical protein